jgi:hypothetical protein
VSLSFYFGFIVSDARFPGLLRIKRKQGFKIFCSTVFTMPLSVFISGVLLEIENQGFVELKDFIKSAIVAEAVK